MLVGGFVYLGFTDDHPKNLGVKADWRVPHHKIKIKIQPHKNEYMRHIPKNNLNIRTIKAPPKESINWTLVLLMYPPSH